MRALLAGLLLIGAATACGKRQVNVETAPRTSAAVMLHFTNNDNSAVNVYVVNAGNDIFLKQVPANTTDDLPIADVALGAQVKFKATRTDSSKTYTSDTKTLDATTSWRVP